MTRVNLYTLGDLATKITFRVVIGQLSTSPGSGPLCWIRNYGHAFLNEVRIEIGGYDVDKQANIWLDVWYELTTIWSKR